MLAVSLDGIERAILHWVTCTAHHPTLGGFFRAIQSDRIGIPLVVLALAWIARRDRDLAGRALVAGTLAFGVGMLLATCLWWLVPRQRPPHAYERLLRSEQELAACASQPHAFPIRDRVNDRRAFPSRHAITIGAFVAALFFASRWAGLLGMGYGFLVLWGRLYVGRHWPTDLLAGLVIGVALAWLAWRAVPHIVAHVRGLYADV